MKTRLEAKFAPEELRGTRDARLVTSAIRPRSGRMVRFSPGVQGATKDVVEGSEESLKEIFKG